MSKFIKLQTARLAAVVCALAVLPANAGERLGAADNAGNAGGRQLASVLGVPRPVHRGPLHLARIEHRVSGAKTGGNKGLESPVKATGEFVQAVATELPPTVQNAADRGCEAARQFLKLAAVKLDLLGRWAAGLWRQTNSLPVMTPAGNSYVPISARHLFLARDGRLKTVAPH